MERYTDTISGEELYVVKHFNYKHYYKDREMTIYHRTDGPAVEGHRDDGSVGDKHWLVNGKLHRLDGPAVEYLYGRKEWYVNGVFIMELDKVGEVTKRME